MDKEETKPLSSQVKAIANNPELQPPPTLLTEADLVEMADDNRLYEFGAEQEYNAWSELEDYLKTARENQKRFVTAKLILEILASAIAKTARAIYNLLVLLAWMIRH